MSPPHDSARAPPARPSRGHQPSFSAALLDAIYQSLEADAEARSSTETRPAPASPAQRTPGSSRHHRTTAAVSSPARSSVRSPRLQRPPRPCRVRPDPQPNPILLPPAHELTGERAEKKKTRRNRKSKRTSKTKAAPFACLLNALLCNRRPARSRSVSVEHTPRATAAAFAAAAPEPASARSILSSRASRRDSAATGGVLTPARRAVRFSPVAVVVDDEGGGGVVGTATRLRDAAEMETVVQAKESAAEAERRVEELLRALGVAEERERAKESSESSSDLFELESLIRAIQQRGTGHISYLDHI
ncbi:protein BIG GRAIN 1-like [Panicum virgatum]|uniref:protein BIG GRAIN 1-like n=1 Tax=Panicum virgatum TaxID=38727 RepID=UPI0019D62149|nr:protein BIG GRAIN 1-like [Panicum virgatum]